MVKLNKVLLFLFFLIISIGTVVATSETGDDMGNKYLVSDFQINIQSDQGSLSGTITANITNQNNGADGDLFYEIKTNPAANHEDVLQSGTISASDLGQNTVGISDSITNPEHL